MIILAVAVSDKKEQQTKINEIISEIKNYEEFIIKKLKEFGS